MVNGNSLSEADRRLRLIIFLKRREFVFLPIMMSTNLVWGLIT